MQGCLYFQVIENIPKRKARPVSTPKQATQAEGVHEADGFLQRATLSQRAPPTFLPFQNSQSQDACGFLRIHGLCLKNTSLIIKSCHLGGEKSRGRHLTLKSRPAYKGTFINQCSGRKTGTTLAISEGRKGRSSRERKLSPLARGSYRQLGAYRYQMSLMLERSPGPVPLLEQNPGARAAWGLLVPLAGGDFRCRRGKRHLPSS